jgi:hypothetical protein
MLARFRSTSPVYMFSPIALPFSGVSTVTRGNVRICVKLSAVFSQRCPFPCFRPLLSRFQAFPLLTRGNVRVRVTLSYACPFSPEVACFHVFAHRSAVFRRFLCNTGQRMCPRQVK